MIASLPIFFALSAMVLWGFEELFLKEAISGLRSLTTFLINTLTGVLLQIVILFVFFPGGISVLTGENLLLAVLGSGIAFTGYFFFYLALERQELSLVSSLDESWIVVAVLIGIVAFGETLGALHVVSILAVLVGAFIISVDFSRIKNLKLISGSGYEFVAVLFVGMSVPFEKFLLQRIGEANTIFYIGILAIPFIFLAKLLMRERFVRPDKKLLKIGIFSGLADGLAFILYLLALKGADIALISPIVASNLLVSVFLARIYLGEKMTKKEFAGAFLILLGVVALSTLIPV